MNLKLCNFMKNSWMPIKRKISVRCMVYYQRVVLGIETSCDDTGAAVVDENGRILGEALLSQKEVHLKTGGILPTVAQQLHKDNIDRVVNEAILSSGIYLHEVSAIATTVKPGLALSLGVGVSYSLNLVKRYNKPFIPIHHMEAHALTIRLLHQVEFPFLVLLISGGHCILSIANGVSDFLLLGQSLDESPGEVLDKVARRLSLFKHAECSSMSGGQSIEYLAQFGNKRFIRRQPPMSQYQDCNFSFAGLRNHYDHIIQKLENNEGIRKGILLSCAADIAASFQHSVAHHLVKRTQRAIFFCKQERLLPSSKASLVVSGGVASNGYIRKVLQNLTDDMDMSLFCPPPQLCTDNGVMIAWNGIERLRIGAGVLENTDDIRYEPRALFGRDISEQVKKAAIKLPSLKNIM
ncbi:probable tRNA N6-adenosine threonylcarbamoyltransferase, mitochondrial [Bufo bufo]|uniref:probable tRNA N6-adenosine threonylcarbamoyltransferase, mitochondrial n=1 Tax=Bufo bufo TaxID=8384 RepID=UPI001ABE3B8F|nr:probable tRNA N6-adenosine threonylcarbamoyltransferase, mitochondrial [Bufo bufo]XP_040296553.1 probable tRNA N6-adenosine threonylcarbamoyltransferase, mitochondrial [Bufo bufo]